MYYSSTNVPIDNQDMIQSFTLTLSSRLKIESNTDNLNNPIHFRSNVSDPSFDMFPQFVGI